MPWGDQVTRFPPRFVLMMTRHIATAVGLASLVLVSAAAQAASGSREGNTAPGRAGWRPACPSRSATDARRHRVRSAGTADEQRSQARSLYSVRGERTPARGDLDRRLGVDGGHGQANRAGRGRATAACRLRARRRLDSLQLASAVSRSVARHQGGHPMAASERRQIQRRPGSDWDHGRQLRGLDDVDGRRNR